MLIDLNEDDLKSAKKELLPVLIDVNHQRAKMLEPLVLITKTMNIYSGEIDEFVNFVKENLSGIDVGIVANAASYVKLGEFVGD